MHTFAAAFAPNRVISGRTTRILAVGWALTFLAWWQVFATKPIPVPSQIPGAFMNLWSRTEIFRDFMSSVTLNLEATAISAVISCGLAYLMVLPAVKPAVRFLSLLRFLGLTGITFVFGMSLQGHSLKLVILTFGMSVYLLTAMDSIVSSIPAQRYQYAQTLRMGPWRTVWEVTIKGTRDQAFDAVRQNAAIGWMMLTAAENLSRSEGGLGVLLLNGNKHFDLAGVFALQFLVFTIGLSQDFILGVARNMLFPWSKLAQAAKGGK